MSTEQNSEIYRTIKALIEIDEGYCQRVREGLRVKMCVWLGVSRGLDLAFLNAD